MRKTQVLVLGLLTGCTLAGCTKDPEVGNMVADIVRGHEDDLASLRKAAKADCR